MNIAKARPLCCFCWLFSITIAACVCCDLPNRGIEVALCVAGGMALVCFVLGWILRVPRYSFFYICFLAVGLALGLLTFLLHQSLVYKPLESMICQEGETVTIQGTVISRETETNYLNTYGVSMQLPDGENRQAKKTKIYLSVSGEGPFSVGDRFVMDVTLVPVEQADEPDWYIRHLLSQGYTLVAYADEQSEPSITERRSFVLLDRLERIQYRLSYRLSQAIGGEQGKLISALLLGTREALSDTTTLNFRRAGASHLLALSGLHLSFIVLLISLILKWLRCPFHLRLLIVSLASLTFLFLTGCSVSMIRATVMLLWFNVARLNGAPNDALSSLSCFFAGCLAVSPTVIYDVALWLTVLATLAVVEIVPALFRTGRDFLHRKSRKNRVPKILVWIWKGICLPIVSSCVVLLILMIPMSLSFGEFSLLTPLSNLILTPLTTVALAVGLITLPLLSLSGVALIGPLIRAAVSLLSAIGESMLRVTSSMSDVRGALVSLRYDFARPLLVALLILFVAFLLLRWKRPRLFLACAAAWICAFLLCLHAYQTEHAGQWTAVYTVKGNGELMCLEQNGDTVLCDLTDGSYSTYRELFADSIPASTTEIEAVVLTHYHNRHTSSLIKLMGEYRVRTVWLPLTTHLASEEKAQQDEGIMRSIEEIAQKRGVEVRYYQIEQGMSILPTLRLDRLYYDFIKRSTHPTLSVSFAYLTEPGAQENTLLCVGASGWESDTFDGVVDRLCHSDVWVLTGHGPKIKTTYGVNEGSVLDEPMLVISAGEDATQALSRPTLFSSQLKGVPQYEIDEGCLSVTLPEKSKKPLDK